LAGRSLLAGNALIILSMEISFTIDPKWTGDQTVEEFIAPLAAAGMTALEVVLHPVEEDWAEVQRLAEHCAALGYRCHFHLPYRKPANLQGFVSSRRAEVEKLFLPAIEFAERMASEYGLAPALVIHGAWGDQPMEELVRDTHEFLKWILTRARNSRPVLELLPHKTATRVGEARDQVLAVVQEVGDGRLGLCWDLGHDMLLGYKDLPTEEFLKTVRHVHIHDVNAAREDHFPLIYGNVPWRKDLLVLQAAGFDGAVTLELNRERTQRVERWKERVVESIAAIELVAESAEKSKA
jgi:sugar phosphate isomerase/epimerase